MLSLIGNSSCELVRGEILEGGQLRIDSEYINRVQIDTIQGWINFKSQPNKIQCISP